MEVACKRTHFFMLRSTIITTVFSVFVFYCVSETFSVLCLCKCFGGHTASVFRAIVLVPVPVELMEGRKCVGSVASQPADGVSTFLQIATQKKTIIRTTTTVRTS